MAVLNTNMVNGFANEGLLRELRTPSMKMGKTKDEVVSMKRSEVIQSKVAFVEENYEKLKGFDQSDDTREIIQASLALHQFILPVYKNEYTQLAKLYDSGASKEETEEFAQRIQDKYAPRFEELFDKLIALGKP
ncbi:MAG TPA: hypothetical protein VM871_04025, partial [Flavisolibacter sp.]|nr:hypothetical protein [Flavisolibacter sp.]